MLTAGRDITSSILADYRPVDGLLGEQLDAFSKAHHEFMEIFQKEEKSRPPMNGTSSYRTDIIRTGWKTGNFWYFEALNSPKRAA
jgi:hypothetical protein